MNERLKQLRKQLNLTLEEFGKPLGVTRSALSRIENNVNNLTDTMINLICKTYNVNEDWLRYGTGEMFIVSQTEYIDSLTQEYHLTQNDADIISNFLSLESEDRKKFLELAKKLFSNKTQN